MKRRGFTLIELLVVIAIIAVLIGVLLPALASVRKTAKHTICGTHIRSLLTAVHTYAVDADGNIPYGPTAGPPAPSNFYPVTGMVTSLIARPPGEPVGAGLMIDAYLSSQPKVIFCPGVDDEFDAQSELEARVTTWAVSNYYYRHGSNTQDSTPVPPDFSIDHLDDHIRLDDLGLNRNGDEIRVLFMDQNFLSNFTNSPFKVINRRTNHERQIVNAGFSDGHVEAVPNGGDTYTIDIGGDPSNADDEILSVFEALDVR